jgi:MATE family multidrug resistance protein
MSCLLVFLVRLEIWYVQGFVLLTGFLPDPEIALDSLSIWYATHTLFTS